MKYESLLQPYAECHQPGAAGFTLSGIIQSGTKAALHLHLVQMPTLQVCCLPRSATINSESLLLPCAECHQPGAGGPA